MKRNMAEPKHAILRKKSDAKSESVASERVKERTKPTFTMLMAFPIITAFAISILFATSGNSTASDNSVIKTEAIIGSAATPVDLEKTEVVYSKLSGDGEALGVYVVNIFESDESARINDPGDYNSIENLTTNQQIECKNGIVDFSMDAGTFRYQGSLDADEKLPWDISIGYTLDGKDCKAEQLGGASGHLKINLDIVPAGGSLSTFSDNFLMQTTATLDGDVAKNIEATGGTTAISGSSTVITCMMIPGSEGHYTIECDVENFEFDGFQLAAVPLKLALDFNIDSNDGSLGDITALENSIHSISEGVDELSSGSSDIDESLKSIVQSEARLASVSAQFDEYLTTLSTELGKAMEGISELPGILGKVSEGSTKFLSMLEDARQYIEDCQSKAEQAEQKYQSVYQAVLDKLNSGGVITEDDLSDIDKAANELKVAYSKAEACKALSMAIDLYAQIDAEIQQMISEVVGPLEDASELVTQVDRLAQGYSEFDDALNKVFDGTAMLSESYSNLDSGLAELAYGTGELSDATSNLDSKIIEGLKSEIEKRLNPDFQMRSFVNSSNTNVKQVQFVVMTEGISAPVAEEEPAEEDEETFFGKVKALFS